MIISCGNELEIVSVAKADRPMWIYSMALQSLITHFYSPEITIVCPNNDVHLFRELRVIFPVRILSEDDYMPPFPLAELTRILSNKPNRAGWYYQQFLKMHFCRHSKSSSYLIWDLDTVLLNPIPLPTPSGTFLFGSSREHHSAYFNTIDKLLGPGSFPAKSAICQYMYVDSAMMASLLDRIESNAGLDWRNAIAASLPQVNDSEFSEYETYATYVYRAFPERCVFNPARLFRYGSELATSFDVALKHADALSKSFDLLAFEQHAPSLRRKIFAHSLKYLSTLSLPVL